MPPLASVFTFKAIYLPTHWVGKCCSKHQLPSCAGIDKSNSYAMHGGLCNYMIFNGN